MKKIKYLGFLPAPDGKHKGHYAIYKCPHCRNEFKALMSKINSGWQKSCGCQADKKKEKSKKRKTRLYNIWRGMRARCYNSKHIGYNNYGGKGIIICDEWLQNFDAFYDWSLANGYTDDLEIDRINNDGDYCPENCRWITHIENTQKRGKQSRNTSGYKGVYARMGKWCSYIVSNSIFYYLGRFETAKDAAIAYNEWIISHGTAHSLNAVED